ncbi:MAG: hypothetical protein KA070_00825 [Aliarcobacter sp.]|nr:hypothetical protein [Aliarcobacter sp.]
MGIFDITLTKKIKTSKSKQDFLEFLEKRLTKNKTSFQDNTLTIPKIHIDSLLRYNLNTQITSNKKESEIIINAELHDTLLLTIIIILSILLTYGIGIIFVILFTYLQKRKASEYLESIIVDYEIIN